jgi:ABC-type transport system involved in cytochrome c biogenesis permease subunit
MHVLLHFVCLNTFTLSARWYISGHAPWSNAYEAIVYVVGNDVFWFSI